MISPGPRIPSPSSTVLVPVLVTSKLGKGAKSTLVSSSSVSPSVSSPSSAVSETLFV